MKMKGLLGKENTQATKGYIIILLTLELLLAQINGWSVRINNSVECGAAVSSCVYFRTNQVNQQSAEDKCPLVTEH